jgi:plastocyanin/methionine-rich copper-binding protein CopC
MKVRILMLFVVLTLVGLVSLGFLFFQSRKEFRMNELKTQNFFDSTPLHGEIFAASPINVTLNFNIDLEAGGDIKVRSEENEARDWTEGALVIENKTTLKKPLAKNLPDGAYRVDYKACLLDKGCSEGRLFFKVDSKQKAGYLDWKSKAEITIDMKDLKFSPPKIIVSPNTKIVWINLEETVHFVNTETHPSHSYFPEQNSRGLEKNKTFFAVFTKPGQYNYHCSAHVPEGMIASIVVEE